MTKILRTHLIIVFCLLGFMSYAQTGTVTGKVLDADYNDPLIGANVLVKGTSLGTVADFDGTFVLNNVPAGNQTIVISFIGFEEIEKEVSVSSGQTRDLGTIPLESSVMGLKEIEIVASRSTVETPFTFTDVKKKDIQRNLGSRDLPQVLNTTPSFYSTNQGGGAGDSRLNVRGFNQRNVAIMINGVPVNDMENGWVYWSNWDGLGDAAYSIQVQRGMSPVNLAVPSIGGTMNIITDPAAKSEGTMFKQEFGSWGFRKSTISYNSGLIDDKLAISGTLVRKTGDGFYQGLYTDAWAYYVGLSYQLNENNKLEAFVIGAPQRHGQNLYAQNIGSYDHEYARGLDDYDPAALNTFQEQGRDFNQNYAPVSPTYAGRQFDQLYSTRDDARRYYDNALMERENFFHKPQVNVNWHHSFSESMQWTTVLYWSGGQGGGSGTLGEVIRQDANGVDGTDQPFFFGPSPWTWDWDETIAINSSTATTWQNDFDTGTKQDYESIGILRNSRNNQYTIGAISKLFYDVNQNLSLQFGVDWRTAEIDHYREVRDLLGGQYFRFTGNEFESTESQYRKRLGDKVDYDYTNTVDWIGFFGQGTYKTGDLTTFLMGGFTSTKYTHLNHFLQGTDGGKLEIESDNLTGYQVKGGASYKVNRDLNAYANVGYISKNPNLDRVIDDESFVKLSDPENQTFSSVEFGINYRMGSDFAFTANYYSTLWSNRTQKEEIATPDDNEFFTLLTGIEQRNSGFELEGSYRPSSLIRFDAAVSFANWEFTSDTRVIATENDAQGNVINRYMGTAYIEGLKEGDAPQTQFVITSTLNPTPTFSFKLDYRYYSKFYSAFNPAGRIVFDNADQSDSDVQEIMERNGTWEVPSYGVFDFHAFYDLPIKENAGFKLELFAHVFNLFDQQYIQDATDDSAFNAYGGNDEKHDADSAEVFFGLPRNYNLGVIIRF